MKTRDAVMNMLAAERTNNGFISGQQLAAHCGISRQAVWKAVKTLRKKGARIEAVTNKGYCLRTGGGILCNDTVAALIPETMHARIFVYESLDSTNAEAKRMCAESCDVHSLDGTVIVAAKQTAGRGRSGRSFFSPDNTGLYLSLIYVPKNGITAPSLLTAMAAVGVCRALIDVYNVECGIKWVNDIFLRGKKVCGILTEGVTNFETGSIDCVIVGIGINILPVELPPDIVAVAGSVLEDKNADSKRNELAASVTTHVLSLYRANDFSDAMSEYRARSVLMGKKVVVHPAVDKSDIMYEAVVRGITDDAKLVVETADGLVKALESGEVSIGSKSIIE